MSAIETREEIERWVLGVCREIGLRAEGADDDFFESGGNSLAAMRIIAQAEDTFGEDTLPPDDLFARSSVREIADSILRNRRLAAASNES
ncbi:phosphopantetheine-binding protein [Streptomyces sp. NPDC049577]|uniref:phosphopantetheine-binding protein n=1 Tax=Streptomyces sp. NPDC049577 TaxID=3155153 RepID=UPI0034360AC5